MKESKESIETDDANPNDIPTSPPAFKIGIIIFLAVHVLCILLNGWAIIEPIILPEQHKSNLSTAKGLLITWGIEYLLRLIFVPALVYSMMGHFKGCNTFVFYVSILIILVTIIVQMVTCCIGIATIGVLDGSLTFRIAFFLSFSISAFICSLIVIGVICILWNISK